jgi:hypothetical protein
MNHEGSTFLSGCAVRTGFWFFAKEVDELVEQDEPNSSFFCFDDEDVGAEFMKYDEIVGWPALSMAVTEINSKLFVVAVGPHGDYWEMLPSTAAETVGKIAASHGNLRKLSVVEGEIFACGMNRTVLQRKAVGQWQPIGPGGMDADPPVVGFEDIAGNSLHEMYAVGWGGEIWRFINRQWQRADSPTSVTLTALTVSPGGDVYAVGHDGMLLTGRHDSWQIIDTGRAETLRDVAFLGESLYVVTDFNILVLSDDGLVQAHDFSNPEDVPATCLHLLEASDGLVAMGTKDVFINKGDGWLRVV